MKLLFTGASGFLGNGIRSLLDRMYTVATVGLLSQNDYTVNIANEIPELHERYDIILHAAGKAHSVPRSEAEKQMFFRCEFTGYKESLCCIGKSWSTESIYFYFHGGSYGCAYGENITEDHPLNGDTPYAMSKRLAEEYLQKWCYEHNVILGIIRPSLIAGPNPPGNLGAMIYGIRSGKYLSIAGSQARKSVLMVQDIAKLVPLLAEKGGIYNVCDSHHPTFRELETTICRQLDKKLPLSIPYWVAKCMALAGDCLGRKAPINSLKLDKITKSLTFSNEKAIRELGWKPTNVLENFNIE